MTRNDSFNDSVEVGPCALESKVERDAASLLFCREEGSDGVQVYIEGRIAHALSIDEFPTRGNSGGLDFLSQGVVDAAASPSVDGSTGQWYKRSTVHAYKALALASVKRGAL
jgi:hypothetical protein